jgi:transposase-like protein
MLGFKSYRTAAVTLAGIELAHRIRKRQFKLGPDRRNCWSLKKQWDRPLT